MMRTAAIAAGLVVVVAIAIYFAVGFEDREAEEQAATTAEVLEAVREAEESESARPPTDAPAAAVPPAFDVVRVDPEGSAVIAGRAVPGSTVTVYAGGTPVGEAQANERGEWVIYVETPLDEGAQELTLSTTLADGTELRSEQKVAVAVPERAGDQPLVVMSEPGRLSRVLQEPEADPEAGELRLEVVDYDGQGRIHLGGKAAPGANIRVSLNGTPIGETVTAGDGYWSLRPQDPVPVGNYTLEVDQLSDDGKVTAIIEVPFERKPVPTDIAENGTVIIERGDNLWMIARHLYGSGFMYTVIYEANKDQIRDPNLIYPDQVFTVPEVSREP